MIESLEVRDRLFRLIDGEASLPETEDWLMEIVWSFDQDRSPILHEFVNGIFLRMEEHRQGHIPQDDVLSYIRQFYESPSSFLMFEAQSELQIEIGTMNSMPDLVTDSLADIRIDLL